MNYLLLFSGIILSLGTLPAHCQARQTAEPTNQLCASFSGNVVAGGKPLAGVSISVKGTITVLITNEEGYFTLPTTKAGFPTLTVSAAGYAPQVLTLTSCAPLLLEMKLLPGTRIKQHGRRKGFIMKTGQ